MNRINLTIALAASFATTTALAADGVSWPTRYQFGLTAVSGMSDLEDKIEANNPRVTAQTISPIGVSLGFYKRLGDNWGVAGTLGPVVVASGDVSFTIVPVGLSARYDISRGESTTSYLRVGIEKAFASGDLVQNGSAGDTLAAGMEFGPRDRTSWGLELAARTLKVDVPGTSAAKLKSAQPYKASLTAFWSF